MIRTLEELKEVIKQRIENIIFIPYFHTKKPERSYLSEELVKNTLNDFDNYLGFQTEYVKDSLRYRIGIKLSRKYTLVIVVEIGDEGLNIITTWKTNRKWQKALQR